MPLYKSGIDMYKKYEVKFNATVIGTRFTDVRDLALERAQAGLNFVGTIRDLVRPILDEYGITGTNRAIYLAFATKLAKHALKHKSEAGKTVATGLKSEYVNAWGCDPSILDEIINVVMGWAIQY